MRLCHVATYYPHRSAFSRYVEGLMHGIREHREDKQYIVGEFPCHEHDDDVYASRPAFHASEDFVEPIVNAVCEYGADLAYLQHAPDLLGLDNRLVNLCSRLERRGVRTVVNSHSIYRAHKRSGYAPGHTVAHFDRAVANATSCIHVHTSRMASDLIAHGVPREKIVVIPHGSLLASPAGRAESRVRFGIPPDAKVAIFFGFVWHGKGLDFLLSVWRDVAKLVPNAHFIVGGYTRKKSFIQDNYMRYLQLKAKLYGLSGRIEWFGDFVPEEAVPYLYGAADVVCLPYNQDYSSVSGVAHQAAGRSTVTLCSDIAKFDEIRDRVSRHLVCPPGDRVAWVKALVKLLSEDDLLAEMKDRMLAFAQETSWANVGAMHVKLHANLLAGKPCGLGIDDGL